jgi:hypothetical protein
MAEVNRAPATGSSIDNEIRSWIAALRRMRSLIGLLVADSLAETGLALADWPP